MTGGVKGMKARLSLEMMRNEDNLARNKEEVQAEELVESG